MEKTIDCRGLSCPQPVIRTKKALDELNKGRVITIVDNEAAKENVRKLAEKLNAGVEIEKKEGLYYMSLTKGEAEEKAEKAGISKANGQGGLVILIGNDRMGQGADELGEILMNSYLYALTEVEPLPDQLIFVNNGIQLTCSGSKAIDHIKKIEEMGVEILSCGTCLDFYERKEDLQVGSISNMYTIVEALNQADKAIVL